MIRVSPPARFADVQALAHASRRHARSPWRNTSRHELSSKIRRRQVQTGGKLLTPGLAGASQHHYARAALLLFAISSRGGNALLQEDAVLSEGGNDGEGFGSHATPKVHSEHGPKIEAKVSANREPLWDGGYPEMPQRVQEARHMSHGSLCKRVDLFKDKDDFNANTWH